MLNPGPLALGSHVLRAAVSASRMPVVEVLLAPAKGRAAAQRRSLLRDVCAAHVAGTGAEAYLEALERLSRARSRAVAARTTKTLGRANEASTAGQARPRGQVRPASAPREARQRPRRRAPAPPAPARSKTIGRGEGPARASDVAGPARAAARSSAVRTGGARGGERGEDARPWRAPASPGDAPAGRRSHPGRGARPHRGPARRAPQPGRARHLGPRRVGGPAARRRGGGRPARPARGGRCRRSSSRCSRGRR